MSRKLLECIFVIITVLQVCKIVFVNGDNENFPPASHESFEHTENYFIKPDEGSSFVERKSVDYEHATNDERPIIMNDADNNEIETVFEIASTPETSSSNSNDERQTREIITAVDAGVTQLTESESHNPILENNFVAEISEITSTGHHAHESGVSSNLDASNLLTSEGNAPIETQVKVPTDDQNDLMAIEIAVAEGDEDEDAMREILEIQRQEELEQIELRQEEENDVEIAAEAERVAKEAEEAERIAEEQLKAQKAQEKKDSDDWVKRSRPGSQAKPGANLKQAKTSSSEGDAAESLRRNRERVPGGGGNAGRKSAGGYFGGGSLDELTGGGGMGGGAGIMGTGASQSMKSSVSDRKKDLERMLNPDLAARVNEQSEAKADKQRAVHDRRLRARIPREYARPVERVLDIYQDERTTLYAVLGVSRSADDIALKKAYRALALVIHPDKNPHPDAKAAFDCIQEAYATLASPPARVAYDKSISRRVKWTWKRVNRIAKDTYSNVHSRWLLFLSRVQAGKGAEEYQEVIGEKLSASRHSLYVFAEKVVLQDTATDRAGMVWDLYQDNLRGMLTASFLLRLMLLPFI